MFAQALYTSGTEMGSTVRDPTIEQDIRFVRLAERHNCGRPTNDEMLDCMRHEVDAETIFNDRNFLCPVI